MTGAPRDARIVLVLAGEVLGGAERGSLELARDLALEEAQTAASSGSASAPSKTSSETPARPE